MKGKLEIVVPDPHTVTIMGDLGEIDGADKLILFNCLAEALELTQEDRYLIGVVIFGGGIEALGGPKAQTVRIASEMLKAVEAIKNQRPPKPLD
jgi:hypothetical protein